MQSPETPNAPGSGPSALRKITPVQWIGLAVFVVLLATSGGLFGGSRPGLLQGNLEVVVIRVASLILAITVHEFSHARVATWFGDTLAKSRGRLTLNPLAHLDPVGTFMMVFAPIGWGKPVPVDPNAMRNPALGWALTSAAGPISNFLTALVGAIVLGAARDSANVFITAFLLMFIQVNVFLGVFNLVPLPPLDGFGFVTGLSPRSFRPLLVPLAQYGPMILLGLIFLPQLAPEFPSPLNSFLTAVANPVLQTLFSIANAL